MLNTILIIRYLLFVSVVTSLFLFITTVNAGTVRHEKLESKTLERAYHYTIYLPDAYDSKTETANSKTANCQRFPVLYLLHGASGDENDWLVKGGIESTLDRLIKAGTIPPIVVVMPGHRGMWWVDANAEQAETVLLKELIPTIEQQFRVFDQRTGRAVAGLSAGGYGTVRLTLRHPELFVVGAALSPAIYQPLPPETSSARKNPPFQRDGAFDPDTWKALNWPNFIKVYEAQSLRVPLYINSGDHDRFGIALQGAIFFDEMRRIQPNAVVYRVVGGDHEWAVWKETIGDALEYMSARLAAPQTAEGSCQ